MPQGRRRRARTGLGVLVAVLVAGGAAPAAAQWAQFGGDPGRSGLQALDPGALPLTGVLGLGGGPGRPGSVAQADDRGVRTSPLISGGPPDARRLAYATSDGRVHVRVLATGAPVGPPVPVDDARSGVAFGGADGPPAGEATSTGLVDTSTAARAGQLLVVHTDPGPGGDVEVAQVDLADGSLVQQRRIAGTEGLRLSSAPVLAPAGTPGGPALLFVAEQPATLADRLVRVPIGGDPAARDLTLGPAEGRTLALAAESSPALVTLDTAAGPATFVAVAAAQSGADRLRTFRADDLTVEGPGSADLGGLVRSPALDPSAGGRPPLFVAVRRGTAANPTTVVHKLGQSGDRLVDVAPPSEELAGEPAPALAVGEKLVVTTGANVTLLARRDLERAGRLDRADRTGGRDGFSETVAAVSGDLAYLTDERSRPLVIAMADGKAVPADAIGVDPAAADAGDGTGFGQPAVDRGFVAFGGGNGVTVARNRDVTAPLVASEGPGEGAVLSGRVTLTARASDARDVARVDFGLNGVVRGTATVPAEGAVYEERGGLFAAEVDTTALPNGNYLWVTSARDAAGNLAVTGARRVTVRNATTAPARVLLGGPCANERSGTGRAETLLGTPAGDALFALTGDDVLEGLAGPDCLYGGDGRDRLRGGDGDDPLLRGQDGDDQLGGDAGADVLSGGPGRDRLSGGDGADRAAGGSAGDSLSGGAGTDVLQGDEGADVLSGGADADRLDGGAAGDRLAGGAGADRLGGAAGDDRLAGDAGGDLLLGGSGRDRIAGGAGNDRVDVRGGGRDVVDCGPGRDRVRADRTDRVRRCERVLRR